MDTPTKENLKKHLSLRRCLLIHLYSCFRKVPLAPVELRELSQLCRTQAQTLNWNMVYLEKKGWVELGHGSECAPYAACSASLTGMGIDLVEDAQTFDRLFPVALNSQDQEG